MCKNNVPMNWDYEDDGHGNDIRCTGWWVILKATTVISSHWYSIATEICTIQVIDIKTILT